MAAYLFWDIEGGCCRSTVEFPLYSRGNKYCLELSDSIALVFGPEFIGRIENIYDQIIPKINYCCLPEKTVLPLPKVMTV